MAPGSFRIHWQFSPPDPNYRDTEIANVDGDIVSDPALFSDYTLTIVGTPLPTITPTRTPTRTSQPSCGGFVQITSSPGAVARAYSTRTPSATGTGDS